MAPAPGTATAPATTQPAPVAPPAAAPAPSISAPAPSAAAPRSTEVVDKRRPRHSTGMMAGGIVMVSFVPVALLAAWIADIGQTVCEADYSYSSGTTVRRTDCDRFDPTIYGGLISAAVLAGVGIPLIVIGGKREPLGSAKLTPWATPQAGGLSFKLEM